MAKPLHTPPPSSSVARLFDVEAASRALAAIPSNTHASPSPSTGMEISHASQAHLTSHSVVPQGATSEPIHIKREFILSVEAEETLTRLVDLYRRSTGARLSSSHLLRAILKGAAACMGSLEQEVYQMGRLKLPSNARGRHAQREDFEHRLAEAFVNAIRAAAAYRPRQN